MEVAMIHKVLYLAVISLAIIPVSSAADIRCPVPAEHAKKIEIVIKDGTAKVISGHAMTGSPNEIVVRNEDTITHGFNSSAFTDNMEVKMEGGSLAAGKGPHVYRVDAGKTMVLKFTLSHQEESATFAFWCDMHPQMKGEMIVVEFKC
jgi:hypothetical protein